MMAFWGIFSRPPRRPAPPASKLPDVGCPVTPGQFPATYRAVPTDAAGPPPPVFDPALKQFPWGYRPGDPLIPDPAARARWHALRRRANALALRAVAGTRWHEHLILRGSMVLPAWLGDAAREPGDVDFSVRPRDIGAATREGKALLAAVADAVAAVRPDGPDDLRFLPDRFAADDIWTYDRAPGRRLAFPWVAEGVPPGAVQMDFVFAEHLPDPPVQTTLRTDGPPLMYWTASMPLSLAWKLLWLHTDDYPQGKDLYDAVLLARKTHLPADLLATVLATAEAGGTRVHPLTEKGIMGWFVDWEAFQAEYPQIPGDADTWKRALIDALTPMNLIAPT